MIHWLFASFIDALFSPFTLRLLKAGWASAPVWVPLALLLIWWDVWMAYKQRQWISEQGSTLVEIKLPREILKSPEAMELFLNNLYQSSAGSLIDVYMKGRVRPWFSLELVSISGTVHFYIWMHKKFKELVESQLYAQFPNIEVQEISDYATAVHHDTDKFNFGWIGQMALTKADVYPIKTYMDYKLHENPDEEFKNDPISAVLEFLGSLRKGEQAWIQIMIRAHAKEGLKLGRIFIKPNWTDAAKKEIEKIRKEASPSADASDTLSKFSILSKGQQDIVSAIERSVAKYAFDTMIRAAYFAENDVFNANNIGGLLGSFRQFSSNTLNGFKPGFKAGYDYPWQDFRGSRRASNERKLLEAYKRRSFFEHPFRNFHGKSFILTTEELATLFHFPSAEVAATPTLSRIPSKKAEPPANLPV